METAGLNGMSVLLDHETPIAVSVSLGSGPPLSHLSCHRRNESLFGVREVAHPWE